MDATGEFPWVHKMIKKYEATAKKTGAILVPQSGVESAPVDLGTWALAKAIRTELGAPTRDVTISLHKIRRVCTYELIRCRYADRGHSSKPSGGTLATALGIWDIFTMQEVKEANSPYAQSPIPHREPMRPKDSILEKIFGVRTIPNLGLMTTSAMASTNIPVVERTWGLLSETPSRKDEFYGPNFTWSEHMKARNWLHGIFIHWLLLIGGMLVVSIPPLRAFVKNRVTQPGEGAKPEDTENDALEYRCIAYPDSEKTTGKAAYCRMWHHGGIYFCE